MIADFASGEGATVNYKLSPMMLLTLMACAGFSVALALVTLAGPPDGDFALFLLPWMDIIRERGVVSISAEFSAYTPPYIYLLNIASLIEPLVGTVVAVKLVNIPFVVATALGIGALVREETGDPGKADLATALSFVIPTMLLNAFAFGQADVILSSFLIGFVLFAMRGKPAIAAVMFGLALSFKLQTIFLSPLLLYLLMSKQMRLRDVLLIPLTYTMMMLPAVLAGRPWTELFSIYSGQTELMHDLSLNAPNPWWFLRWMDYRTGVIAGLIAGGFAGAAIVAFSLRTKGQMLLIATVCAAVMPYILPKMTSRYFFVADILAIALAIARPGMWPVAVLIQIGSLVAYVSYFSTLSTTASAFIPMTLGIILLVYFFSREVRSSRPDNAARE